MPNTKINRKIESQQWMMTIKAVEKEAKSRKLKVRRAIKALNNVFNP